MLFVAAFEIKIKRFYLDAPVGSECLLALPLSTLFVRSLLNGSVPIPSPTAGFWMLGVYRIGARRQSSVGGFVFNRFGGTLFARSAVALFGAAFRRFCGRRQISVAALLEMMIF